MLFPIQTASRSLIDLNGLWQFKVDAEDGSVDPGQKLTAASHIAVPASFNDQIITGDIRDHSGYFYYQTTFQIAQALRQERLVLRFGSVTHEAWVYLNGEEIGHHKGGFTPFEFDITAQVKDTDNLLTVRLSNLLDHTTLPVGNYSETKLADGTLKRHVDENFDFYNYAGIHRPVKIYTTPSTYIEDVTITSAVAADLTTAQVDFAVDSQGGADIHIQILDEAGIEVAAGTNVTALTIDDVQLWQPLAAYLYTARVSLLVAGQVVDTYDEPFGVRTIDVRDGQFLINQQPFYFKGFGKHEDSYIHGRGFDAVTNVLDIQLLKAMGANSLRTSHYPYAEEMMRLCDREGIVVIDETTAVGIMANFNFDMLNTSFSLNEDQTFSEMDTQAAHEQVIQELIQRDKNHACVVMWSLANESAQYSDQAYDYFQPLFDLARQLDPQQRPCTLINIMMATPQTDKCASLVDVICLNRYYGWYLNHGHLDEAAAATRAELAEWQAKYPQKPIMYTEYGADTVAGFHSMHNEPFSEEYQEDYYAMNHAVFDEFDNFVGEQLWNFADFATKNGIQRVQGNKKGVFTRNRQPKMVVRSLQARWQNIPDFGYKTK